MTGLLTLTTLLLCASAEAEPAPMVPALKRAPRIDGTLSEWKGARSLSDSGGVRVQSGHAGGTLYLAVSVHAPPSEVDGVTLSLGFRNAGPLAAGHQWRFDAKGNARAQVNPGPMQTPRHAIDAARASGVRRRGGFALEIALPAPALPRFPTSGPWIAELCLLIEAAPPARRSEAAPDCARLVLQVPASLTAGALPARPPKSVESAEGRTGAWLGFGPLAYPTWLVADQPLSPARLRALVSDGKPVDPAGAGINLPDRLFLPGGAVLLTALVGRSPFDAEGGCDAAGGGALRLALYRVGEKGRTAEHVLDWIAADCALGRLGAVELDEAGELTLGYTSGATAMFLWSKDHFEKIEIGSR